MTGTSRREVAPEAHSAPPSASPRVRATAIGTHLLVVVSGEADLDTSQALREDLRAALADHPNSVAVELSRLTSCDRAALQAITDFCAEAASAGVPTVIHGSPPIAGVSPGTNADADHTVAPPDWPAGSDSSPTARPAGPDPVLHRAPATPRPWPIR